MHFLGLENTLNELARASGVKWHGHVLKTDNDEGLRKTLDFEVVEKRAWATAYVMKRQMEITCQN